MAELRYKRSLTLPPPPPPNSKFFVPLAPTAPSCGSGMGGASSQPATRRPGLSLRLCTFAPGVRLHQEGGAARPALRLTARPSPWLFRAGPRSPVRCHAAAQGQLSASAPTSKHPLPSSPPSCTPGSDPGPAVGLSAGPQTVRASLWNRPLGVSKRPEGAPPRKKSMHLTP